MFYKIVARSRAVTVLVVSTAVVATLAVVLPTSSAQAATPTFAPAQLINESALEAPAQVSGSYYPGGMFAATTAERAAVNDLEGQAVANTLADHGLPAGDGASVLSYARNDADANLWALVLQAVKDVHAGTATNTELDVNQWLIDSLHRQSILSTQDAGLEYTKWAGLGVETYNSLIANDATEAQLSSFLSTTPNPYTGTGSSTNPAGSTEGGYCTYQSPAPDQGDYTDNIFGDDAPQTCYTPCTSLQDCGPPVPDASQFATWGSADYEEATLGSFGSSNGVMATAASASLLATVTTVGSGFVGLGTGALFNGSDLATSFLNAVRPFATRGYSADAASVFKATPQTSVSNATSTGETTTEGVEDGLEAADEVGLDAGSTGIGIVLTAIIFVITTAIQEGLKVVGAADVPSEIAGMIDSARTSVPDPYASEQSSPGTMFALFMNATLPQPSHQSCDNDLVISSQAALGTPCLNPTPIPAPTSYDPGWTITPKNGTATNSGTLTLTDSSSGYTPSYRLHGNWVISTATVSGTTASTQTLSMHYTDWSGTPHTAWVYADHTPTSFVTVADDAMGAGFDPNTCQESVNDAPPTCAVTSSIDVVGADGTDETVSLTPGAAAPTLPAGPCTVGPGCDAINTTTSVTGPTTVAIGNPVTYSATVNGNASVTGTVDFVAGAAASGCTGTALQALPNQGGVVTGKVATCTITFAKAGTYFLFGTYNGASTYQPSQGELTVEVGSSSSGRAETTTSLSASANPVVGGEDEVFTATVDTGGSGVVPGGTVEFDDSDGILCAAAVLSETAPYTATCPYAYFAFDQGTIVPITATYSGDDGTLSSQDQKPLTFQRASTETTVTASTDHPRVGQQVTYTATVTIDAPGGGIPQGGVTFTGGASCDVLEVTRAAPFVGVCTTTYATAAGALEVDASYRGDTTTEPSLGGTDVFVGPASTTTTGTPSASPYHIGQPMTDTASVSTAVDTATGGVSFSVCGPLEFTNVGCHSGGTSLGSAVTLDGSGKATSASFTPSHAGVYCFRADYAGDTDYTSSTDGSSTNCATVNQLNQQVTFTSSPPSDPQIGGTYVGLAATGGASGNAIEFGSITPDVCTVTGTTVTFDASGTCTVQALQPGAEDYLIGETDQSFTIDEAQAITFTPPTSASYGDQAQLAATGGGGTAPVVFSIDHTSGAGVCAVSGTNGTTLTYTAAGTCRIDANQAGSTGYAPAPQATESVTVAKRVLTFTITPAHRTYGQGDPSFAVTSTGYAAGDSPNVLGGAFRVTAHTTINGVGYTSSPTSPPGNYLVYLSGLTSRNYSFHYVTGKLTVSKAPLMLTVNDSSRLVGEADPAFSVTPTGLMNGESLSALTGTLVYRAHVTINGAGYPSSPTSPTGNYIVYASGLTSTDYSITYVTGRMKVIAYKKVTAV